MATVFFLAALLLLLCPLFVAAQVRRGFQPEDIYALREVSDAQLSPDGSRVVYTVSEVSPDHRHTISHLWIVPTAGGAPQRLTGDEASESTARWSPDGRLIAYFSDRDKQPGLWIVNADGSAPQLVAHLARTNFFLPKAGESFTWSPDSRRIAFLTSPESVTVAAKLAATDSAMAGIPERLRRPLTVDEINQLPPEVREMILRAQGRLPGSPSGTALATAAPQPAPMTESVRPVPDDPRVITRLRYKSRTAFSDSLQSHIFIADLTTKQIVQLTDGKYYEHSINWSPKGDEIVFVSNHEPDPDQVNNTDLFVVNVTNGKVRQLTKTTGCEWQPVFSPDGSQLAYLATKRAVTTIDSVAEDTQAYSIAAQGGPPKDLSSAFDRRVSRIEWTGARPVFAMADQGKTMLLPGAVTGSPNNVSRFMDSAPGEQIVGYALSRTGHQSVYLVAQDTRPAEVRVIGVRREQGNVTSALTIISRANDELSGRVAFSPMREFSFNNEGFEIQGWLVAPVNLDEKKKYPVILSIHGGPHGMHGYSFNPTVQALAARGYAVLLINPRGSSGYGQKFADGCVGDWGGGDYRDLMRGVDEALARFPFLDKDRMGVMGGSYGGYMTNWVVTQTDRFRAAVASASLSNLISFYATSLYQDLIHAEFNGYPWDNYELLWERSPLKHIKKVKTPLLLIHGENDNDVHITQAEEMYTAVRMRGVEAMLVRYPREGHGLRELVHRVDSLRRTIEWFDRHLK